MINQKNIRIGNYYKYYWNTSDYLGYVYLRISGFGIYNDSYISEVISDEAYPTGKSHNYVMFKRGQRFDLDSMILENLFEVDDDEIMVRLI